MHIPLYHYEISPFDIHTCSTIHLFKSLSHFQNLHAFNFLQYNIVCNIPPLVKYS